MNRYVFDACALIAYYADEEGADLVQDIIGKAYFEESQILISKINLLWIR